MKYFLAVVFLVLPMSAWALTLPDAVPNQAAYDFANILSPQTESELESLIDTHETQTTNEIAIVTVPTLQGGDVVDYAVKLFQKWGIGQEGKDNGVLILVAPTEREVRIEVGYGLEPTLTDIESKIIIDDLMTPEFRNGNFDLGINKGVRAVIRALSGEEIASSKPAHRTQKASQTLQQRKKFAPPLQIISLLIIGVVLVLLGIFRKWQPPKYKGTLGARRGATIGAGIGFIFASLVAHLSAIIYIVIFFTVFGFIVGIAGLKGGGGRSGRGGGWRSGGGFGGGGGGFGGGSSGGGGASGKW